MDDDKDKMIEPLGTERFDGDGKNETIIDEEKTKDELSKGNTKNIPEVVEAEKKTQIESGGNKRSSRCSAARSGSSSYESDESDESPRRKRKTRKHKKKKRSSHGAGRMPTIPEFGKFPVAEQFAGWRDWMGLVNAALLFAPDWDENQKASYLIIAGGTVLRDIINTSGLMPVGHPDPFEKLVSNIEAHLYGLTDSTLTHQALLRCKQRQDEPTNDYHVRLMKLMQSTSYDNDFARTHFLNGLFDRDLANTAITNGWRLEDTVAAAARKETLKYHGFGFGENQPLGQRLEAGVVAAVENRRIPQRRPFDGKRSAAPYHNPNSQRSEGSRGGGSYGNNAGRKPCPDCGFFKHRTDKCPAIGKSCSKCGKSGHFKKVCRSSGAATKPRSSVNQVNNEDWD